ncbi:2-amino-4-hydroxy-6-hydroxymethyldihydropteridine diphosphokinase [Spiribacter onubensis]|uniref:2-amino-4-hydroxy-6-hydroxymethyldihydropteridine pyrophosphokinase n=1 Tax=Spiribacter onubensis TaxID=3122420 RepID=A0ABV3S8W4_9GAMM
MAVQAFIGIGSNLADPVAQVRRAIDWLDQLPETARRAASRLYRNPPMGPADQPDYVNAVAELETALSPQALLDALQGLEADAGRDRDGRRWGPRPLDLDLLVYGDRQIDEATLTVPHPGLASRAFVLHPLAEIAPALLVPGLGTAAGLAARVAADDLMAVE